MNKQQRNELRHEVYSLWYHSKDEKKKVIYQKVLDLIEYTEEVRARLKSVVKLFDGML